MVSQVLGVVKMVMRMIAIAVVAAALLAVFSVGDAVHADDGDYAALKKLITENRVGERVKLDANDKLTIPTDPNGGVAYRLESVDIDGSTGAMTTTSQGVARFHLPATDAHKDKTAIDGNGIAIYAGTSYHIALDAAEDGFSAYVAVNDSTAPTRYEFGYDLPSGFKLSEDGAGGIEILNSDNEVVGDIAPPWAVDANGAAVRTAFKLVDDDLVQTIQHSGAAYPVVADPTVTLGWRIYLWFDVPDEVSRVAQWSAVIHIMSAIRPCTAIATLASGAAGALCWGAYIYWGMAGADAINSVISRLPSNPPDDCQLVLAFRLGLLEYVEHSGCGTSVKERVIERVSASELWSELFG